MARRATRGRVRHPACAIGPLVAVATACAGGDVAEPVVIEVPDTVVIGDLPGPFSATTSPLPAPDPEVESTTTTEAPRTPVVGPLYDAVLGRRVLLIGDTALAVTAPRADGIMCELVTDFGWDTVIEAEYGRTVEFAAQVLDERLDDPAGWDVVGLMFGHHLSGTVDDFERTLDDVLDRLDDHVVVLYTVAEIGDDQSAVNRVIAERDRSRPNVVVVDWADAVAAEPDKLLDDDGPVPSVEGAGRLALFTVALLGEVPGDVTGECLEPLHVDDRAVVL